MQSKICIYKLEFGVIDIFDFEKDFRGFQFGVFFAKETYIQNGLLFFFETHTKWTSVWCYYTLIYN